MAAGVAAGGVGCASSSSDAGQDRSHSGGFTATGPNGSAIAVPNGKPAVIYFFTAGCSQGAPAVAAAQRRVSRASYIAVDLDPGETADHARSVLRAAGATDTGLAVSTDTSLVTTYGVSTVGTTVVIDTTGKPVYTGVEASTDQITAAVATTQRDA
ncbi:MAG: TlpA family protein disulfide reductase [Mycobacteriales bacterium]